MNAKKLIAQCNMSMRKAGDINIPELIMDLKTMCSAYRNDFNIFSNTHDDVARKFLLVLNDLNYEYINTSDLRYCYESAQCIVLALQQILKKEDSVKFQKRVDILYEKYPEILSNSGYFNEKYKNEIEKVKEYLIAGRKSTSYDVRGMEIFLIKYKEFQGSHENNIENDTSLKAGL